VCSEKLAFQFTQQRAKSGRASGEYGGEHTHMNGVHILLQKRARFASILSHSPTGATDCHSAEKQQQKNKVGSPSLIVSTARISPLSRDVLRMQDRF